MLLGSRCEPDDVREESISYGVNTPYDNSGTLWSNLGNKPNLWVVKKQPSINSINNNQITRAAPSTSGRAKKQILINIKHNRNCLYVKFKQQDNRLQAAHH